MNQNHPSQNHPSQNHQQQNPPSPHLPDDPRHTTNPAPQPPEPISALQQNASRPNPAHAQSHLPPHPRPKRSLSPRQLAANRANAQKSTGPRTPQGKSRSALNATRHGILSQVVHLPEEELHAYTQFTVHYIAGLHPIGPLETELAHALADLQFRLHRLAAAEHNLFALGHEENGSRLHTGAAESHAALTFADTLRRSRDPLLTLSLYEARLHRRFLQTLKALHDLQAQREAKEEKHLYAMHLITQYAPHQKNACPRDFGFVCSDHQWSLYQRTAPLLGRHAPTPRHLPLSPLPPASSAPLP